MQLGHLTRGHVHATQCAASLNGGAGDGAVEDDIHSHRELALPVGNAEHSKSGRDGGSSVGNSISALCMSAIASPKSVNRTKGNSWKKVEEGILQN